MDKDSVLRRLKDDVIRFDHDDIREAASLAMEAGIEPQRAINEALLKGLEEVDRRYRNDEYFLPDLIMASEAMNEAVKTLFKGLKENPGSGPDAVLATVKGDIHDIGKNILAGLLRGSGVSVYDLGVDVAEEEITSAVEKHRPRVLCLSAMLSTTREEIKSVIKELERKGFRKEVKIIIGGASTGRVFASLAGADAYAEDALIGAAIVRDWINGKKKQ